MQVSQASKQPSERRRNTAVPARSQQNRSRIRDGPSVARGGPPQLRLHSGGWLTRLMSVLVIVLKKVPIYA